MLSRGSLYMQFFRFYAAMKREYTFACVSVACRRASAPHHLRNLELFRWKLAFLGYLDLDTLRHLIKEEKAHE
eukprot:m.85691 g.85691  ORF g.85691 m.85691 type:complete len:73 (-) comp14435_c1_seq2:254-472(-)